VPVVLSRSADLGQLISRGETVHVEFKTALPRPSELAREISALANTGGGWLIIGVEESAGGEFGLRGVDVGAVELALQRALLLLRPAPPARLEVQQFGEQQIAFIATEPVAATPVLMQGMAFVRDGARTVPANARHLMQMVSPEQTQAELLLHLQQFSNAIETQNKTIEAMRAESGWRNKLLWAVIGGVIGLLFSIPTLLFQ
jgi:predicted HTH transcriptional regulator